MGASDFMNELSDRENETVVVGAQESSSSVTDDHQSSLASKKSLVEQESDKEGIHQQVEGHNSRQEISLSTWLPGDRDDMEWDSAVLDTGYHHSSFQVRRDTLYDELFHDPWADTQL